MDENFLSGPYPIKEESISEIVNCGWSCGHSVLKGQLKKNIEVAEHIWNLPQICKKYECKNHRCHRNAHKH